MGLITCTAQNHHRRVQPQLTNPGQLANDYPGRLVLLGHIGKMKSDLWSKKKKKKLYKDRPEGRRKVGRPRRRWTGEVEGENS